MLEPTTVHTFLQQAAAAENTPPLVCMKQMGEVAKRWNAISHQSHKSKEVSV